MDQPRARNHPESTITKPPSAELRPDQLDQDSLPPYDVLDSILEAYVVDGQDTEAIIASGHDEATVQLIIRLININEYKRRQAAPGIKSHQQGVWHRPSHPGGQALF